MTSINEWSYSLGLVNRETALHILNRAGARKRCLFAINAWRQLNTGQQASTVVSRLLTGIHSDDSMFCLAIGLIIDAGWLPHELQTMLRWAAGSIDEFPYPHFDPGVTNYRMASCLSMREVIGRLTTSMVGKKASHLFSRMDVGKLRRMADEAYETDDYESLPVMADMLQDAGIDDSHVLHHLRGRCCCGFCGGAGNVAVVVVDSIANRSAGPPVRPCVMCDGRGYLEGAEYEVRHCRGCWVLDLILGLAPKHLYAPIPDR